MWSVNGESLEWMGILGDEQAWAIGRGSENSPEGEQRSQELTECTAREWGWGRTPERPSARR